jgi:glycosyltransferase 2 family protein
LKVSVATRLTLPMNCLALLSQDRVSANSRQGFNHLPAWLNLALAIFVLVVVAAYLSWVGRRQRAVGRDNWQITLPGGRLTLVQIGIGILDLGLSSFAMYMLLPGGPSGDFVAILVTFIFATLLGFASHSPGGLGVFDAAMLIASPQFEKERYSPRCSCSACSTTSCRSRSP